MSKSPHTGGPGHVAWRLTLGSLGICVLSFPSASAAYAGMCSDIPTGGDIRKTVVVTSQDDGFEPNDFTLGRTIGQIIETAGAVDTESEQIAMMQSIIRSFNRTEFENPDSGLLVPVQMRPEANLDPRKLLDPADDDGLRAVGVFNRFDLADAAFETCGEHRIVYLLGDGQPFDHRMTMIFEAAVPNPAPDLGEEGCLPIIEFWQELETASAADIQAGLEEFFYTGLDVDSDGTPDLDPVVHADHYGFKGGQVRGNLFVVDGTFAQNQWQLREWLVGRNLDTSPTFTVETIKDNPQEEFYTDIADPLTDFADLQRRFQQDFLTLNLVNLMGPEIEAQITGNVPNATQLIAGIAGGFGNEYNDFQSISGDPGGNSPDEPLPILDTNGTMFKGAIDAQLGVFNVPNRPTADHLANRAGAMTCGGCHQFSAGEAIAPDPAGGADIEWPASLIFVHIDENGQLSPALTDNFLVSRCERVRAFLEENAPTPSGTEAMVAAVKSPSEAQFQVQSVRQVEFAEKAFVEAQTIQERSAALGVLEAAVKVDRQRRDRTPGAFYRVRRTH